MSKSRFVPIHCVDDNGNIIETFYSSKELQERGMSGSLYAAIDNNRTHLGHRYFRDLSLIDPNFKNSKRQTSVGRPRGSINRKSQSKNQLNISLDLNALQQSAYGCIQEIDVGATVYKCEDGMVFVDDNIAMSHQLEVDKAKLIVEIALSNCGYVVAEQLFITSMDYTNGKLPRNTSIRDIMNNDKGVQTCDVDVYYVVDNRSFDLHEDAVKYLNAKTLKDIICSKSIEEIMSLI